MENLNAEAIKSELKGLANYRTCPEYIKDALALINSQEQRIKELTEDNKWSAKRILEADKKVAELTQANEQLIESYDHLEMTKDELLSERSRLIEKCQEAEKINKEKCTLEYTLLGVMHSVDKWLEGAELEQDEVKRAITMREKTLQIVEKLTEENERLQDLVKEVQEYNESWVKDNGRLRGILLEFTDIVYKWGNKHGYDTSEISLVPIINEESAIKKQIREETIKEFQSRLNEQRGYDDDWNYNSWWGETINQIAKEIADE